MAYKSIHVETEIGSESAISQNCSFHGPDHCSSEELTSPMTLSLYLPPNRRNKYWWRRIGKTKEREARNKRTAGQGN